MTKNKSADCTNLWSRNKDKIQGVGIVFSIMLGLSSFIFTIYTHNRNDDTKLIFEVDGNTLCCARVKDDEFENDKAIYFWAWCHVTNISSKTIAIQEIKFWTFKENNNDTKFKKPNWEFIREAYSKTPIEEENEIDFPINVLPGEQHLIIAKASIGLSDEIFFKLEEAKLYPPMLHDISDYAQKQNIKLPKIFFELVTGDKKSFTAILTP